MNSPTSQQNILAALTSVSAPTSCGDLADGMKCNRTHVAAQLKHLVAAGQVRRHKENDLYLYQLARR
jgi:predicted transcriptional regulator